MPRSATPSRSRSTAPTTPATSSRGTLSASTSTGPTSPPTPIATIDAAITTTDLAGNTGNAADSEAYSVDTSAPAAPSAPDLDAASDSGASNSDNVTNDTTPTFSGTAEPGATVSVYDGAVLLGTTVATAGGTWSFTSGALAEGPHSISATATDAAGNVSPASARARDHDRYDGACAHDHAGCGHHRR